MRAILVVLAVFAVSCGAQETVSDGAETTTTAAADSGEAIETDSDEDDASQDDTSEVTTDEGSSSEETPAEVATTEAEADPETSSSTSTTESITTTEAPETSTSSTSSTTTTTEAVAQTSGDPELDALIDELAAYVEAERGLEFLSRPQVQLLDDDEFGDAWIALINEDAAENATSYADFTDIYQTMGIISDDRALDDIWRRFGEAGVLGYYETSLGAIVLRNGEINTLARTTLVHELVHALEDQHFGLSRDEYDDRTDEIGWTFSSLIEGSARVIENRYRSTLTEAELQEEVAAIQALPRSVSLTEFNSSFLELQFGRYNYGEDFADVLWAEGGQAAIDAALTSPPTSSELILNPFSFTSGARAEAPLAAPPAEGEIFEQGVWGEAAWIALFADSVDLSTSVDLADGWGGDWYVAWRDGAQTCVRIDVSADDADEFVEYERAIAQWARLELGRELETVNSETLRLTVCE